MNIENFDFTTSIGRMKIDGRQFTITRTRGLEVHDDDNGYFVTDATDPEIMRLVRQFA